MDARVKPAHDESIAAEMFPALIPRTLFAGPLAR